MTTPNYTMGEQVSVDFSGLDPLISSVSWTVIDEDGNNIVPAVVEPVSDMVGHKHTVVVPANYNNSLKPIAGRTITITMYASTWNMTQTYFYLLTSNNTLQLLTNSFQTYEQAVVLRAGMGQTFSGWDLAPKIQQCTSLATAYTRLNRLAFKFTLDKDDAQEYDLENPLFNVWDGIYRVVRDIAEVPLADYTAFPDRFKTALCRAQLVEADIICNGDIIGQRRLLGVASEKIGESAMSFRPTAPLDLPISRAAFKELTGFVYRRYGVIRG